MSVYKRGKQWCAVVYDPATNKHHWAGTHGSKREAREAEDKERRNLLRHRGGRETIQSFADRWMDDYPRRKESTTVHYRQQIKALAKEFGHLRLDQLDRVTARAFALRSSTWPAARAMFSDAVRTDLCESNPFTNMRLSQGRGRKDLVVPTPQEVERLAEIAGEVHGDWGRRVYGPMILFAAYTGCRPGELHGLDWRHVDRRARTLLIERQWNPKLRKMTDTKNGRSRTIWLPPVALSALDGLPDTGDALFTTPREARMGGATSHYYFFPVASAFGRIDLTPHCLRHFYGTHLASLGVSAENIAQAMGHTDGGKLALSTYIHATELGSRAAIAKAFGSTPRPILRAADSIASAEDSA